MQAFSVASPNVVYECSDSTFMRMNCSKKACANLFHRGSAYLPLDPEFVESKMIFSLFSTCPAFSHPLDSQENDIQHWGSFGTRSTRIWSTYTVLLLHVAHVKTSVQTYPRGMISDRIRRPRSSRRRRQLRPWFDFSDWRWKRSRKGSLRLHSCRSFIV